MLLTWVCQAADAYETWRHDLVRGRSALAPMDQGTRTDTCPLNSVVMCNRHHDGRVFSYARRASSKSLLRISSLFDSRHSLSFALIAARIRSLLETRRSNA